MFKSTRFYLGLFVAFFSMLTLIACGDVSAKQIPSDGGGGTYSYPPLTLGSYTTIIGQHDLDPFLGGYNSYLGQWEVKLENGGRFWASQGKQKVIEGTYSVNQDLITFSGGNWSDECNGNPDAAQGTYRWAFDGGALALNAISDNCSARTLLLLAHPLTLSSQS